jgi:thiamine-phosphate pyrophosphorylase
MSDYSEGQGIGSKRVLLRMADANRNRVMEGLRTLEDLARFSGFGGLQSKYKEARHRLQGSLQALDSSELLSARDTRGDVGCEVKTASEFQRPNAAVSIGQAAGARVEQGLRVLEECAKVIAPEAAASIEKVRYEVYDLNAALVLAISRDLEFLSQARLYVLVDCRLELDRFAQRIREISEGGVQMIQIRDKERNTKDLVEYIRVAMETVDTKLSRIIINDRVDVAQGVGAAGVHLGQEDLSVGMARRILTPVQYVGLSTHSVAQVAQGAVLGVDYIGCGPTFPSQTKSFDRFSGIEFLTAASGWLQENQPGLAAFAIGGIHLENIQQVLQAGFFRVAVSQGVWGAAKPREAALRFREILENR